MRELRLAEIAKAQGKTLTQLATQMRPPISREHLSRLASGRQKLSYPQAVQLAELLGVNIGTIAVIVPRNRKEKTRHKVAKARTSQAPAGRLT